MALSKTQMIHLRCDERDRARLAALAEHLELGESAVLRQLIKEACERYGVEPVLQKLKAKPAKPAR
jgi:hypothetical protein